jgi:GTP1/Obg family GTP-binding protein
MCDIFPLLLLDYLLLIQKVFALLLLVVFVVLAVLVVELLLLLNDEDYLFFHFLLNQFFHLLEHCHFRPQDILLFFHQRLRKELRKVQGKTLLFAEIGPFLNEIKALFPDKQISYVSLSKRKRKSEITMNIRGESNLIYSAEIKGPERKEKINNLRHSAITRAQQQEKVNQILSKLTENNLEAEKVGDRYSVRLEKGSDPYEFDLSI